MIKAKYTLGDKSTTIEFETIEQLLKYERAQKDESYQSLPESFDKDAFHKKVDEIKASREIDTLKALSDAIGRIPKDIFTRRTQGKLY